MAWDFGQPSPSQCRIFRQLLRPADRAGVCQSGSWARQASKLTPFTAWGIHVPAAIKCTAGIASVILFADYFTGADVRYLGIYENAAITFMYYSAASGAQTANRQNGYSCPISIPTTGDLSVAQ